MADKPVIRPMEIGDVKAVVDIHLESFPGFFLSYLGADFLSLLYQSMLADPSGVVLVATKNGRVEGFVAGVTAQSGFYQRALERHKWRFALASLAALARRPSIAGRLLRALRRPQEAQAAAAAACLMSIAVRPDCAGSGIGGGLVEAFGAVLNRKGVTKYCLTTDRDNNDRVNSFYEGRGFQRARTFATSEGRAMNEYVITLRD